jgi:hypothetical protein
MPLKPLTAFRELHRQWPGGELLQPAGHHQLPHLIFIGNPLLFVHLPLTEASPFVKPAAPGHPAFSLDRPGACLLGFYTSVNTIVVNVHFTKKGCAALHRLADRVDWLFVS